MNFIKLIQLYPTFDPASTDPNCITEKEREVLVNLDNVLLARESRNNTRLLFHGTKEEMLVKISFSEFCERFTECTE